MKIKKLMYILMLLMTVASVSATSYLTWDNTFTNTVGLKDLATKGADTSTKFGTISWTETSTNTSVCTDQIRCRFGSDDQSLGAWTTWKTSGTDLDTNAQYIDCQLNLTTSNSSVSNCSVSNINVAYQGYAETYGTTDVATSTIDGIVTVVASLVGFGALIGIVMLYKFIKK